MHSTPGLKLRKCDKPRDSPIFSGDEAIINGASPKSPASLEGGGVEAVL